MAERRFFSQDSFQHKSLIIRSAPVKIRTSNLLIRSQMLYPVELRAQNLIFTYERSRQNSSLIPAAGRGFIIFVSNRRQTAGIGSSLAAPCHPPRPQHERSGCPLRIGSTIGFSPGEKVCPAVPVKYKRTESKGMKFASIIPASPSLVSRWVCLTRHWAGISLGIAGGGDGEVYHCV